MFHTKRFVRHPTLPGKYKTVFHRKSSKKEKTPPFQNILQKNTVFVAKPENCFYGKIHRGQFILISQPEVLQTS